MTKERLVITATANENSCAKILVRELMSLLHQLLNAALDYMALVRQKETV